jgi:hypothetical protein
MYRTIGVERRDPPRLLNIGSGKIFPEHREADLPFPCGNLASNRNSSGSIGFGILDVRLIALLEELIEGNSSSLASLRFLIELDLVLRFT